MGSRLLDRKSFQKDSDVLEVTKEIIVKPDRLNKPNFVFWENLFQVCDVCKLHLIITGEDNSIQEGYHYYQKQDVERDHEKQLLFKKDGKDSYLVFVYDWSEKNLTNILILGE